MGGLMLLATIGDRKNGLSGQNKQSLFTPNLLSSSCQLFFLGLLSSAASLGLSSSPARSFQTLLTPWK